MTGKREERKRISSLKKSEREAKRTPPSVQTFAGLVNENPTGGV